MKSIALTVALLVATQGALAAPPAPAAPGAKAPATPKFAGVSDEGNAIAHKTVNQVGGQMLQMVRQLQDTRGALVAQVGAATVDLKQVEPLMRQLDKLQADLRSQSTTNVLTAAKAMNDADRAAFLRDIVNAGGGASR